MALPPDTTNDAFVREVEENYRRDQLEHFAKRYGIWIAAAIILFLAAVGGWIYWQNRQQQERAEQSEVLSQIFADIGGDRLQTVPQRLDQLAQSGSDSIRASALLTKAAVALERNDRAGAIAAYRQVAEDDSLPEPYRNLATIRSTALEFDSLQPAQIIARLQPLAQAGSPWFGSAGEMTALAHMRAGRNQQAARLFAAIAADQGVPEPIRSRSVQIAGSLGVDASASLPALQQQDTNQ